MRLAPAIALAVVTVLALGACQQQSTPIVPTPAPSASPLFASDEEALAAAEEAYRAFQEMSDQILRDGGENPERLKGFVTDEVYAKEAEGYAQAKQNGWRLQGSTSIDTLSIQSFNPGASPAGLALSVYACVDLSGTDVIDQGGDSVVSVDRQTRMPFQTSFVYSSSVDRLLLAEKMPWTGDDFCAG